MIISDEFKRRAKNTTGSLTPMHHEAMDILYAANLDGFTLDQVVALLEKDGTMLRHDVIAENKTRIRVIAARMLDRLLETELIIQRSPGRDGLYSWVLEE